MDGIRYGRKRKGIKKELTEKVNDWIGSITDKRVADLARRDTIVTGGSIASMLLGEKINDFDIYFLTKETTLAIAQYYVDKFNSSDKLKTGSQPEVREETIKNARGVDEDRVTIYVKSTGVAEEVVEANENQPERDVSDSSDDDKYRPVFLSQNAITLSRKVQLVIRFFGSPDQIHDNYDFVHAKCYWMHRERKLVLQPEALESMLCRNLHYSGSLYPIASIFRMKKFITRGWRITAGEQLKIMWQISELDMKDINVIREQLTGVDMAYLHSLIHALENVPPERINSRYVIEIINRIFEEED